MPLHIICSSFVSLSWVPNWNPPVTAPQRGCWFLSWSNRYYRAGGREQAKISLSRNGLTLMAPGITFDAVTWMSRVAPDGSIYHDWHKSVKKKLVTDIARYRNGQSVIEAYQGTLVAGCGADDKRINQTDLSEGYDAFSDGSWKNHGSSWKYYSRYEARAEEFYEQSTREVMGKRLCITAHGYIGLVPRNIRLRDRIIVLSGHMVPLVLRSRGGRYVLAGESYIHGIMEGEALERPDISLERISIH